MTETVGAPALHHVGISVADLDEACSFFALILAADPIATEHHDRTAFLEEITGYDDLEVRIAFFELPGNGVILEILEYVRPRGQRPDAETFNPGNTHVAIRVKDIQAEFDRLSAAGLRFRSSSPIRVEEGPLAGTSFAYIRGSNGLTVELCEVPH